MCCLIMLLQRRYGPSIIIHWEDVASSNAFQLLQLLHDRGVPTFNDDIQCTAAVSVAAVLVALRLPGVVPLERQTFLFFGAGQVMKQRLSMQVLVAMYSMQLL